MSENRVEWIDFVRAIAIITVLYIHATDGIYNYIFRCYHELYNIFKDI